MTVYIIEWTDDKYGVRHTERYVDIEHVRRAVHELREMNAHFVHITKEETDPTTGEVTRDN